MVFTVLFALVISEKKSRLKLYERSLSESVKKLEESNQKEAGFSDAEAALSVSSEKQREEYRVKGGPVLF